MSLLRDAADEEEVTPRPSVGRCKKRALAQKEVSALDLHVKNGRRARLSDKLYQRAATTSILLDICLQMQLNLSSSRELSLAEDAQQIMR